MAGALLGPNLEQGRDGAPVVRDQGEAMRGGYAETIDVVTAQQAATLEFRQWKDAEAGESAAQATRGLRRYVLIEQQLEHARGPIPSLP